MDEFEMRRIIYDNIKEICHFSQMQVFATSSYQRNYFQLQIDELIGGIMKVALLYNKDNPSTTKTFSVQANNQANNQQNNQEKGQENNQEILRESIQENSQKSIQEDATKNMGKLRKITREELAYNDGADGRKAFVAVNTIVYDVSNAIRWAGGTHFGLYAGQDLTNQFMGCHNGMMEILKILPIAGTLEN